SPRSRWSGTTTRFRARRRTVRPGWLSCSRVRSSHSETARLGAGAGLSTRIVHAGGFDASEMAQGPAHFTPAAREQHAVGLVLLAQRFEPVGGDHPRLRGL